MSDTPADKVEEVDLDALDDAPAHDAKAAGSTTIEEVRPEELAESIPLPEVETTPWLLALPMLVAVIVLWNVDWADARVQRETAARSRAKVQRARKAA